MADATSIQSLNGAHRSQINRYIESLRKRPDLTKRQRRDLVQREIEALAAEEERAQQRRVAAPLVAQPRLTRWAEE